MLPAAACTHRSSGRAGWRNSRRGPTACGELLYAQLDQVRRLRRQARRALLEESRKHLVSARLREIPGLGPLRVARLIAYLQSPHRFRSRSKLWGYVGLGLATFESSEYRLVQGRIVRRAQPAKFRGLNRNHQPRLKEVFKSAALTAIRQPGPWKNYYDVRRQAGRDPARLRLSVARKLAALVLSLWKKGGHYRAAGVHPQA